MATPRPLDGTEPIDKDELVYRRILVHHYDKTHDHLSPQGFYPRSSETTGISLIRSNYLDEPRPETAAGLGQEGKSYWIIEMTAGSLESAGLSLKPEPSTGCLGHAVIPILNANCIREDATLVLTAIASELPRKVYGPFPGCAPKRRRY